MVPRIIELSGTHGWLCGWKTPQDDARERWVVVPKMIELSGKGV